MLQGPSIQELENCEIPSAHAKPASRSLIRATPESIETTDLRRTRERSVVNLLLTRCPALPEADQALIQAVYGANQSIREVARLRGEGHRDVARRVKRLIDRMLRRDFAFVLAHRSRWTSSRRRLATACFIHGLSIRDAAASLNMSFYIARRHHEAVLALLEAGGA